MIFKLDLSEKVNSQLKENSTGRLFAVILAAGKQRKITQEDVIILDNNDMKVEIGDKIVLNKVICFILNFGGKQKLNCQFCRYYWLVEVTSL